MGLSQALAFVLLQIIRGKTNIAERTAWGEACGEPRVRRAKPDGRKVQVAVVNQQEESEDHEPTWHVRFAAWAIEDLFLNSRQQLSNRGRYSGPLSSSTSVESDGAVMSQRRVYVNITDRGEAFATRSAGLICIWRSCNTGRARFNEAMPESPMCDRFHA